MTTTDPTIRVFIAPINQPPRGLWKDVGGPHIDEEIREEMARVREETGAEELILADAEGLPSNLIPRYGGVPVEKIATFYELADLHGAEIARAYVEHYGHHRTPDEWEEDLETRYRGTYDTETDWAYEYIRDVWSTSDIPEHYIDHEAFLSDVKMSGDMSFYDVPSGIAAFSNH